ncbi:MAG TPA: flippase-like domain-containing protein, partial [Halococcus sp.]|nr:flippase-like domain-containing protein [Halococcus sp.]
MNRRQVGLYFLIALALFALLGLGLDVKGILAELRHADLSIYALAIALSFATLMLWAVGLYGLLATFGDEPDFGPYTAMYLAGMFARRIAPWGAAVGNSLIAYLVSQRSRVEVERCLAATAVWEFLNIVASLSIAVIGLFVLLSVEGGAGLLSRGVNSIAAAIALTALVAVIAVRREEWLVRGILSATDAIYSVIERVSPERAGETSRTAVRAAVRGRVEQFFRTVHVLAANRVLVAATVLATAGAWVAEVLALYLCLLALGISVHPAVALVAVPVAGVATL